MPITTEEELLAPEESPPPSPSFYLDIPRSPYGGSVGDPMLSYISHILMEDDIDDRSFYQYPDHPALLQAQQPFAGILDEAKNLQSGKDSDTERRGGSLFLPDKGMHSWVLDGAEAENNGDQSKLNPSSNEEMLKLAFLKGMEEANKFLPRDNELQAGAFSVGQAKEIFGPSGSGEARKGLADGDKQEEVVGTASKLMVPELEDDGARELFDSMMLSSYKLRFEAIDELEFILSKIRNKTGSSALIRYKQWQQRNQRAGLRQLPLKPTILKVVTDKVKRLYHKDFLVDVHQGWLLQGWKGRVLYAHSAWVADDTNCEY